MPIVTEQQRLQLVVEAGHYFKRHGMRTQVESLRVYYRHLRESLNPKTQEMVAPHQLIDHYFAVLRIPPFDTVYEVRTERSPCACGAAGWRIDEKQLPDRWFVSCHDCGPNWLVLGR